MLTHSKRKPLLVLLSLISLFILPMIAARIFYHQGRDYLIKHSIPFGTLVQPPYAVGGWILFDEQGKNVVISSMQGKWLLLYIEHGTSCEEACKKRLYAMKQIHVALGKESHRVKGWFLTPSRTVLSIEPARFERLHIRHGQISEHMLTSLSALMPNASEGGFYLVDPLSNLMMAYPQEEDPNHILKDVKRLLKASRIG